MAATQLKVIALEEFKTDDPSANLNVKLLAPATLGKYELAEGSVLHCGVLAVVDPKRGKRNASFYVRPISYTTGESTYSIKEDLYGKYSKFVLSKEEIKQIPPGKVIKSTALTVGNYFVKGLSIAYSFAEGVVKNEKDNRLKSGVSNAYEHSPLSYISEGEQLDIHVGDDFYLVFKSDEEDEVTENNDSDKITEKKKKHRIRKRKRDGNEEVKDDALDLQE